MIAIIERLEENAESLPSGGGLSTDPNPRRDLVADVRRAIDLCRVCLAYYDDESNEPDRPWKERIPLRGTQQYRPWKSYQSETWLAIRDRLMRLLIRSYPLLSMEDDVAESSYDATKAERTKFRASDLIYVLQAHVLACAYAKMTPAERTAIGAYSAHEKNE